MRACMSLRSLTNSHSIEGAEHHGCLSEVIQVVDRNQFRYFCRRNFTNPGKVT